MSFYVVKFLGRTQWVLFLLIDGNKHQSGTNISISTVTEIFQDFFFNFQLFFNLMVVCFDRYIDVIYLKSHASN